MPNINKGPAQNTSTNVEAVLGTQPPTNLTTFASLLVDTQTTPGTPAYTSDQGLCIWTGTAWVPMNYTQSAQAGLPGLQTKAEAAVNVTPTYLYYAEGDIRRYGAIGDGVTNNYTAIKNAIAVANATYNNTYQGSGSVYIPGGIFRFTPTGLAAGTTAASASQNTSTGIFTTAAQSFVAGTAVTISGTLPTGFSAGVIYYVIASSLSSTTCKLSTIYGGSVTVPSGSASCTLTVQTGLYIPSGVTIYGLTRQYNVCVLQPYQCSCFIIDGNGPLPSSGNYVEDIWLKSFYIDAQYANATNVVYWNNVYTVLMRDIEVNGGYTNLPTVTNMMGVYGTSGDINCIFDDVSLYGNARINTTVTNALNLQKNGGTVKFINVDVEYCVNGINNQSIASIIDFISPYSESCGTVNYYHGTSIGAGVSQTNIFGGTFGGSGSYAVNIQSDNLLICGLIVPAGSVGICAYNVPTATISTYGSATSFKNVRVIGGPNNSSGSAQPSGSNLATVAYDTCPNIPYVSNGKCYNVKVLTSGAATSIFSIQASNLMTCRVTLFCYQTAGYAAASAEYLFCVPLNGLGALQAPALLGQHQAIDSTINTVTFSSPTLVNSSGNYYVFGITATNTGSGGVTTIQCYAKLEWDTYDGTPAVNVILAD